MTQAGEESVKTGSGLLEISLDIDSSVVNVEGHQEGTAKGYNPRKPGNPCYNLQFAFCDEIKAYLTGYVRSGDTYTANGAAGMIAVTVRITSKKPNMI
jgi:hypothetical protein